MLINESSLWDKVFAICKKNKKLLDFVNNPHFRENYEKFANNLKIRSKNLSNSSTINYFHFLNSDWSNGYSELISKIEESFLNKMNFCKNNINANSVNINYNNLQQIFINQYLQYLFQKNKYLDNLKKNLGILSESFALSSSNFAEIQNIIANSLLTNNDIKKAILQFSIAIYTLQTWEDNTDLFKNIINIEQQFCDGSITIKNFLLETIKNFKNNDFTFLHTSLKFYFSTFLLNNALVDIQIEPRIDFKTIVAYILVNSIDNRNKILNDKFIYLNPTFQINRVITFKIPSIIEKSFYKELFLFLSNQPCNWLWNIISIANLILENKHDYDILKNNIKTLREWNANLIYKDLEFCFNFLKIIKSKKIFSTSQ